MSCACKCGIKTFSRFPQPPVLQPSTEDQSILASYTTLAENISLAQSFYPLLLRNLTYTGSSTTHLITTRLALPATASGQNLIFCFLSVCLLPRFLFNDSQRTTGRSFAMHFNIARVALAGLSVFASIASAAPLEQRQANLRPVISTDVCCVVPCWKCTCS